MGASGRCASKLALKSGIPRWEGTPPCPELGSYGSWPEGNTNVLRGNRADFQSMVGARGAKGTGPTGAEPEPEPKTNTLGNRIRENITLSYIQQSATSAHTGGSANRNPGARARTPHPV
ncbi:hypothetical protein GCM10027590_45420 [Nocardiopsis nanhaiensis]